MNCSDQRENSDSGSVTIQDSQLNRSCPEKRLNTSIDIKIIKEEVTKLTNKLEIADNEIENLVSENYKLREKINQYEKKILHLTQICRTPSKTIPVKDRKRLNRTIPTRTSCKSPNLQDTNKAEITLAAEEIIPDGTNSEQDHYNNNAEETVSRRAKAIPNDTINCSHKHRVLLLADETGRGMRDNLEKRLGSEYIVTSILKPYASLGRIISSSLLQCENFTKSDYVIILAGSHDKNLIRFQSALYHSLNIMTNTNVIFGRINESQYFNKDKLNEVVKIISLNIENINFSELCYFRNHNLDKANSCRALIMDMILINYKNKLESQHRMTSSDVIRGISGNASTQTEDIFFRNQQ